MGHERRVFVESVLIDKEIPLSKEDSHYLSSVLRLSSGSSLVVISRETNEEYEAFVVSSESQVTVKISSKREKVNSYRSRVDVLLFALCKHEANELALEKCTELGVSEIWFFQSERSVIKLTNLKDREKKVVRFKKIAEASSKQSARVSVPEIRIFGNLPEVLEALQTGFLKLENKPLRLVAALADKTCVISELQSQLQGASQVLVAIGPEGDFSPQEYILLQEHDFLPITLGGNRLRAETAAIAAVSGIDAVISRST